MHLLLVSLKTVGWDELPEGFLVCRHLPPTASPEQTASSWKTLCRVPVCVWRGSHWAPGEGSLLQKPLSCVPFRNNVFELAAWQRQVLQGTNFIQGPRFDLGSSGSRLLSPSFLVALSPPLRDVFSPSIPTCPSLFFSSRPFVIDCSIPSVLSVGVAASLFFFFLLRPAREPESISASDFLKFLASCVKALNPQNEQIKSKTRFALPDAAFLFVINLYFLLFPSLVIIGRRSNIKQ